jgi:hypothetical protein
VLVAFGFGGDLRCKSANQIHYPWVRDHSSMGVNMRQKVRWATHLSHEVLVCSEPPTHAPDDTWHDLFGIRHRFVGRHMIGQMVFVHISDGQQKGAQARARSFTTVALHVAYAFAVIISCPFLSTMAHTGVTWMRTHIVWTPHRCTGSCCQAAHSLLGRYFSSSRIETDFSWPRPPLCNRLQLLYVRYRNL